MPFQSKRQLRWAFATRQPFARRWARATRAPKRLPERAQKAFTIDELELAVTKSLDPLFIELIADRVPELAAFKGERIAPGVTRIRGDLCNVHGRYGSCSEAGFGGDTSAADTIAQNKRRIAQKPPKKTAEQRAQERAARQQQAAARRAEQASARAAKLRQQAQTQADRQATQQQRQSEARQRAEAERVAEQQRRGAQQRAEAQAQVDRSQSIARQDAERRAEVQQRQEQAALRRQAERDARDRAAAERAQATEQQRATRHAERARQRQERQTAAQQQQAAARVATLEAAGLTSRDLRALRSAADGTATTATDELDLLQQIGFVEDGPDGPITTDAGRRALRALERNNIREYRAALQDIRQRQAREKQLYREKHLPGGHDQRSHGRSTPRRVAFRMAYQTARSGGATQQQARASGRDASTALRSRQRLANIETQLGGQVSDRQRRSLEAERARLQQDITTRTGRMHPTVRQTVEGATIAPTVRGRQDSGLFGSAYQERQRVLQDRARQREQAQQERPRQAGDLERAGFINQQLRLSTPAESKPIIKPASVAPPTTPLANMASQKPERYAAWEDATRRVVMPQQGWNEPITSRQQSYLGNLAQRAVKNTTENTPQRELAQEIVRMTSSGKLTKWEASQFIDALNRPKPMSSLLLQAKAGMLNAAESGGDEPWRAIFALPGIRASLINDMLYTEAQAEGLPF